MRARVRASVKAVSVRTIVVVTHNEVDGVRRGGRRVSGGQGVAVEKFRVQGRFEIDRLRGGGMCACVCACG